MLGFCSSCSSYLPQAAQLASATPQTTPALTPSLSYTALPTADPLLGDVIPVHDPSITRRADGTYVVFTTDLPFLNSPHFLKQRCSADLVTWAACGYVFDTMPAWVKAEFPDAVGLWAPDISWFGGLYHLYYAVSTLGSQHSAIGVATNRTLDPNDPQYEWVDGGEVLASSAGADFNAIDPNVLVDSTGTETHVWLNYGSFWGGLYQQELDPTSGRLMPGAVPYHLAQQPAAANGAMEGAAMIAHNGWYYLFASVGICCNIPIEQDTYQQIVGRSRSVHGPFLAQDGTDLLQGGGTVLLTSDSNWLAPGGGSLWQSADGGQTLLTFHALERSQNGALALWVEPVTWKNDWPVLQTAP